MIIINNHVGCRHRSSSGFWSWLGMLVLVTLFLTWPLTVWPGTAGKIITTLWIVLVFDLVVALAVVRNHRA